MQFWPPRLIATAKIAAVGTVTRSVGISSVTNPGTGNYLITLTNPYDADSLHVSAIAVGSGAPSVGWAENNPAAGEILIAFEDDTGAAAQAAFTLRVYQDA